MDTAAQPTRLHDDQDGHGPSPLAVKITCYAASLGLVPDEAADSYIIGEYLGAGQVSLMFALGKVCAGCESYRGFVRV